MIDSAFFPVMPNHSGKKNAKIKNTKVISIKKIPNIIAIFITGLRYTVSKPWTSLRNIDRTQSVSYNPKDHFFKKAKAEDYLARSIYKLQEIDEKSKLIKKGHTVLDLGASPGSWSQYALKKVGHQGRVIGIDLTDVVVKAPNYTFFHDDINNLDWDHELARLKIEKFDGVISDMAPKTTGIKNTDQMRSLTLCELALDLAVKYLKPKGYFVCKLFHSDGFKDFNVKVKLHFDKVDAIKPDSTRKISKEIFIVGLGFKP